jgi:hypothetical protein
MQLAPLHGRMVRLGCARRVQRGESDSFCHQATQPD